MITAVNRAGEILWTIETGASSLPAQGAGAIAEGGTLYFQAGTKLYCINPDGTINWIYDGMGYGPVNPNSPAFAADGTIYILGGEFGNPNWGVVAINLDGTEKWRSTFWTQAYGTPIVADDGFIYVAGHRRIYKLKPEDGSKVWETPDSGQINQIALLDNKGNSYLAVAPNMVMCYGLDGSRKWFTLLAECT
jgi:outer membrane protein assembly factor BamB